MQLLIGGSARIYGISTILAFITGLMPFAPLLAATVMAIAAKSPVGCILGLIAGAWLICNLVTIAYLGSRKSFPLMFAIGGSSIVFLLCGFGLFLLASAPQKLYDPLYFTPPISAWAWEAIPFVFNSIQVVLSILRYQQLHICEVTPCPQ
jgi:hypothetical protein